MPNDPSLLFSDESEDEIYARIVADFGAPPGGQPLNLRPGSNLWTLFRPQVLEHIRIKDFAEKICRLGFLQWSQGDYLDAKAAEFGAIRKEATFASVVVLFVGVEGTIVPSGTIVATSGTSEFDGVRFVTQETVTIPVSGEVEVPAIAEEPGVRGNVNPGDINQIVTGITGISFVTNNGPGQGGLDVEDDESLRQAALVRARSIPQSGNKATYRIIAQDDPEVGTVYVEDFWDQTNGLSGNGTARVVVGGYNNPWVSSQAVERLQQIIDPTIKGIAYFENEAWIDGAQVLDNPIEGYSSRKLEADVSSTESMHLNGSWNLSSWDRPEDEIWFSIRVDDVAEISNISSIEITFGHPSGVAEANAKATLSSAQIAVIDTQTLNTEALIKLPRSAFVITNNTETFSWGNIGVIEFTLNTNSNGPATVVFDGLRVRRDKGDFLDGQAPIGIQILVRSARALFFDLDAEVELAPGQVLFDVESAIDLAIREYFNQVTPGGIVRISEIANAIHDTVGVVDYGNISISNSFYGTYSTNFTLAPDQRPVLNTMMLTQV